jgi:hypothetical protein
MITYQEFLDIVRRTEVLRPPRHRIATFGETEIRYYLLSPLPGDPARCRLRVGALTVRRPKILTREALADRFEGFGEEARAFERWLLQSDRDAWRALEYQFQNRLETEQFHTRDARELADDLKRDIELESLPRVVLLLSPDETWQFALMKFILDETARSFRSNVGELEDRGLFDPAESAAARRKQEVESLFRAAASDAGALQVLGQRLREYGLFEEYQDRFFSLVPR